MADCRESIRSPKSAVEWTEVTAIRLLEIPGEAFLGPGVPDGAGLRRADVRRRAVLTTSGSRKDVSEHGRVIDQLFMFILWLTGIMFVATEVALFYFAWKYDARINPEPVKFSHGSHTLEVVWTILPAVTLLFIAIYQMNAWADAKMRRPEHPDHGRDHRPAVQLGRPLPRARRRAAHAGRHRPRRRRHPLARPARKCC